MSEIDQVHLRAVMLFMSETSEIVIIFNIHRIYNAFYYIINVEHESKESDPLCDTRDVRSVFTLSKHGSLRLWGAPGTIALRGDFNSWIQEVLH